MPYAGELCLFLSLAACVFIAIFPLCSKINLQIKNNRHFIAKALWSLQLALSLLSLLTLVYCYVFSDFTVVNVVNNSNVDKPLLYKIFGAWSNHEGSMLLLVTCISFYGFLFSIICKNKEFVIYASSAQAFIIAPLVLFILVLSNPFERIFPAPLFGMGLNPILQDVGLSFHPPILYMGYMGFSIVFSIAIASLILKRFDKDCIDITRAIALIAWSFLTLGVGAGSWWAYRELGWGGYWFWDPVENVSLMPWLTSVALIHSMFVAKKTQHFIRWSILLSIMTFSLSIMGTFIVRSGIITSVHSFATDPDRGFWIFVYMAFIIGCAMALYITRAHYISRSKAKFSFVSKEFAIALASLIFMVATFIVFIGTIYPIVFEIFTNNKISIGAMYFNKMFSAISLLTLLLCTFGMSLSYKQGKISLKKHGYSIACSVVSMVAFLWCLELQKFFVIEVFIIFCALLLLYSMLFKMRKNAGNFCAIISHAAFAVIVMSICANAILQKEVQRAMEIGDKIEIGGVNILFTNIKYLKRKNHLAQITDFAVDDNSQYIHIISPEVRLFPLHDQKTPEAAILRRLFYDIYLVVSETEKHDNKTKVMLMAYYRPMISWLWFGAIIMFMCGLYRASQLIISHRRSCKR